MKKYILLAATIVYGVTSKTSTIMKKGIFCLAILFILMISACRSNRTMCNYVRSHYGGMK